MVPTWNFRPLGIYCFFTLCFAVCARSHDEEGDLLSKSCAPVQIPYSNRTLTAPCSGVEGDQCFYSCDPGYLAIGKHVCQSYTTKGGRTVLSREFFGGRCQKLCSTSPTSCPPTTTAVRMNSSEDSGPCFATICLSPDDALRRLAKGNYEVWRLSRSDRTGIYAGEVNPSANAMAQSDHAHIGTNGLGVMTECIAAELGFISQAQAQQRVNLTLSALAGLLPGFTLKRNSRGWIPTFFNRSTGGIIGHGSGKYTSLDTGLNAAGVLFAKRYFQLKDPDSDITQNIIRLADIIWTAVRFEDLLCNKEGKVDPNGTAIPFTFDDGDGCQALHLPEADDGFYEFSELHYVVWLSYERSCAGSPMGKCKNKAAERMWQAWQGRRLHPNLNYSGIPLLSKWPSYIVQLPFYSSHSFNSDDTWRSLFHSHWAADFAYYHTAAYYAGEEGRYGLAAGFTDPWCSAKHSGYEADMLVDAPVAGAQGCRMYSPYGVAGYLPTAPETIKGHLLQLLASGDSLLPMPEDSYVLLRKSLLEPGWNQNSKVSMVDFVSEIFGLSTIWLGADFFTKYSDHFSTSADSTASDNDFLSPSGPQILQIPIVV